MVLITSNWPPSASFICWPAPLYGISVMSAFDFCLICSSITWPTVPRPEVAQRTEPGLALAWPTTSAKPLPLKPLVATTSTGEYITLITGATSFCGS
ncbi:hypothetical protein D3C72_1617820 [compost metagenome]